MLHRFALITFESRLTGQSAQDLLARQRCVLVRQADPSCRFRSVWVWITAMRIMVSFKDGGAACVLGRTAEV
jgi:hypothetical protein